jgi:Zn-dependent peptidase ImmA (M78 family)
MRRELSPRRARFDIAHEIGHTLFYDIGASPPRRLLQPGDAAKMSVKEESLCSEFARQLLVPVEHLPQLIRDRVQERPTEFVSEISRRYMVSSHVALRCLLSETRDFARSVAIVAGQSPSMQARCFWGRQMRRPRKDERDLIRRVEHALVNGDRARLRELDYNQFLAKIDIGQEIKSGRAFRIAILSFQP